MATEISPLGMYLEMPVWEPAGEVVEVLVSHYLLPTPALVKGRKAYLRPIGPDRVGLGLEFSAPLSDEAERFLLHYGSHFDRRRVLMVDDEPGFLRVLDHWMDRAGYKFLGVDSPFDTIEGILRFRPHVLIVSCDMPGLSGPELCRLVRATPSLGELPVVLFSSGGANEMQAMAEACGAAAWVHRHARVATLVKTVERLVLPSREAHA